MKKRDIPLGQIFLEAFFVVLGVVLALGANEWRQAANRNDRMNKAVESIAEEIAMNQETIRSSVSYHISLSDSLYALRQRQTQSGSTVRPSMQVFSRGFIHPTELLTISYDLSVSTDAIGNMDYDRALAYARIYDRYASYQRQQDRVSQMLYGRMFSDGFEGVIDNYQNLATIIGTLYYVECDMINLVREHAEVLNIDDERVTASPPERCTFILRRQQ